MNRATHFALSIAITALASACTMEAPRDVDDDDGSTGAETPTTGPGMGGAGPTGPTGAGGSGATGGSGGSGGNMNGDGCPVQLNGTQTFSTIGAAYAAIIPGQNNEILLCDGTFAEDEHLEITGNLTIASRNGPDAVTLGDMWLEVNAGRLTLRDVTVVNLGRFVAFLNTGGVHLKNGGDATLDNVIVRQTPHDHAVMVRGFSSVLTITGSEFVDGADLHVFAGGAAILTDVGFDNGAKITNTDGTLEATTLDMVLGTLTVDDGVVELTDALFQGSHIDARNNADLTLSNVRLTNATSSGSGTCLAIEDSVMSMTGGSIDNCHTTGATGFGGGALLRDSSVTFVDVDLTDNVSAYSGGALYVSGGSVGITGGSLFRNRAEGNQVLAAAVSVQSGTVTFSNVPAGSGADDNFPADVRSINTTINAGGSITMTVGN